MPPPDPRPAPPTPGDDRPAPCPWCGGEKLFVVGDDLWAVFCDCGANGTFRDSKEAATLAWNAVANLRELVAGQGAELERCKRELVTLRVRADRDRPGWTGNECKRCGAILGSVCRDCLGDDAP